MTGRCSVNRRDFDWELEWETERTGVLSISSPENGFKARVPVHVLRFLGQRTEANRSGYPDNAYIYRCYFECMDVFSPGRELFKLPVQPGSRLMLRPKVAA